MSFFGFDPDDLPEEMPDEMKKAIQLHAMKHEHVSHEIAGFFETLNEDNLRIMRSFLQMIAANESPTPLVTYYIGLCQALQVKFGICLGCGRKHDDEAAELFETDSNYTSSLEEYGLEMVAGEWPKVRCINCGLISQSLDDRMLRKPKVDGCPGCQQKAKTG